MAGPSNDVDWMKRVAEHVCGIITCEGWCDCSRTTPQVTLGNETVVTTDTCTSTPQRDQAQFIVFNDCANDVDRICFKWRPLGVSRNPSMECLPEPDLLACLTRSNTPSSDLLWQVCLDSSSDQCIDAADLCSNISHAVLPRDQCDLCERNEDDFTPETTGDHVDTSPPGNTADVGHSNSPNNIQTTGGRRMVFIIGVCVGIGGAVVFGIFCACVFYIHRKLNRNNEPQQGSQSNYYSTVEHPLRAGSNGVDRPNSTGLVAGSNLKKKTVKYTPQKDTSKRSHMGPYTDYQSDRPKSCYAELQNVASDSALASRDKRFSDGHAFNIFSEYQEPDLTLPPDTPGSFLFEESSMAPSPSFNSFKLAGQYMDPQDAVRRRSEDNQGRIVKQSTRTSEASSGKVAGTLYSELVQTLNRKKAISDFEHSPQEPESENPYAEVGELRSYPISNHPQPTDRQRNSQLTDSSNLSYRTYEEIKPHTRRSHGQWDSNDDIECDRGGNPQYFVLEDSVRNTEPPRQYFELEQFCEDRSDSEGHAYFTLEKPSSLPLDKKKKRHRLSDHDILYNYDEQSATINDSNQRTSGSFQMSHIADSGDYSGSKSVSANAHAYFQLERPGPGESGTRKTSGPSIQEPLGDSAEVISVRSDTLTFYPGGRKRTSTQSLEEQAYDKLNRSARSSRRNVLTNTAEAPISGPYGVLDSTSDDECKDIKSAKKTIPKLTGRWKK